MGGCKLNPCIQETRKENIIQPYSGTRKSSRLFDRIDLYSEHSGIWSGVSGDGGQSGGRRVLGRLGQLGRCCQRTGGLCSRRRWHNCDHRGQLSSRPNTSSISSASASTVIAIARQKHGMLSQSQQRLGVRHGSRPYCRSTGLAAAQDTFTASASRRPPCHRGNPPSGMYFTSGLILPFPVGKAQMQIDTIFFREIATETSFSVKLKRAYQQNTN